MKISLITRRNKKLFDSKIHKKSPYLRSLTKKKKEGIKKVEEEKAELILDKILKIGQFERDYKFFNPQKNNNTTNIPNIANHNIKNYIKNQISSYLQRENQRYDLDKDRNNYTSIYNEKNEKIKKSENFITKLHKRPLKKVSFLAKIGGDVVTSSNLVFEKNNNKTPQNNF